MNETHRLLNLIHDFHHDEWKIFVKEIHKAWALANQDDSIEASYDWDSIYKNFLIDTWDKQKNN